jgi:lambda family phage tail tape measure protein
MLTELKIVLKGVNETAGAWGAAMRSADDFKLKINGIEQVLANLASLGTLYQLARSVQTAVSAFEQMDASLKGLAAVARYSGVQIGDAMQAAGKLSADGLMQAADASKALQNLLARGFSLDEAVQMLERLKDAAAFNRVAHLSMSEAVVTATEGIKNENSILVDNAGVTKNVSVMWKEYADQLGKGVNQLTQAEKRQAEFNGILRETEAQAGNAKLAAEGLTGAKARLTSQVKTLAAAFGETLVPGFSVVAAAAGWALDKVKAFIGGIEILATRSAMLWEKIKLYADWANRGFREPLADIRAQSAALDQMGDDQINQIIAKWEGRLKAPQIGADTGKRRQDAPATDLPAASRRSETANRQAESEADAARKKELEARKQFWDQAGAYHDAALQVMTAQAEMAAEKELEVVKEKTAGMVQTHQQAADTLVDLTQRTAEAMEQNFSDFFFNAITGKLKTLNDFATSILNSIARAAADVMGQMAATALFGKSGGGGGLIEKMLGALIPGTKMVANGAVFGPTGLAAFARGGVVFGPTVFPFAGGIGLMGEAGPEAVLPLKRGADGRLGVTSTPAPIQVHIHEAPGTRASVRQDNNGTSLDVVIEQLEGAISGRMSRGAGLAGFFDNRYRRSF